jgi:hypothetical protein
MTFIAWTFQPRERFPDAHVRAAAGKVGVQPHGVLARFRLVANQVEAALGAGELLAQIEAPIEFSVLEHFVQRIVVDRCRARTGMKQHVADQDRPLGGLHRPRGQDGQVGARLLLFLVLLRSLAPSHVS